MTHAELAQKRIENPSLQVIDLREAAEVDVNGMIEGAEHIPMGRMFIKAGQGELSPDTEMAVYCASGTRADIVARELSARGFKVESVDEAFPVSN
jgi:rhodanese-related sulfurtransferase